MDQSTHYHIIYPDYQEDQEEDNHSNTQQRTYELIYRPEDLPPIHVIERPDPEEGEKPKRKRKPENRKNRVRKKYPKKSNVIWPSAIRHQRERREKNFIKLREEHRLKPPCKNCRRNCTEKFTEEHRLQLNNEFWEKDFTERHQFVKNNVHCTTISRHRDLATSSSKRVYTYHYNLKNQEDESIEVCRTMFLATVGYNPKNNSLINSVNFDFGEVDIDRRGKYNRNKDPNQPQPILNRLEIKAKLREEDRQRIVDENEERVRLAKYRHPIQAAECGMHCRLKCLKHFSEERRLVIHDQYWRATRKEREEFHQSNIFLRKLEPRRSAYDPIRKKTIRPVCSLLTESDERVFVCYRYYLYILGYSKGMTCVITKKLKGREFLTPEMQNVYNTANEGGGDDDESDEEEDKSQIKIDDDEDDDKYENDNNQDANYDESMEIEHEYSDEPNDSKELVVKIEPEIVKSELETTEVIVDGHFETIELDDGIKSEQVVEDDQDDEYDTLMGASTKFRHTLTDLEEMRPIRPPCNSSCRRKCTLYIPKSRRQEIHRQFWSMDIQGRYKFLNNSITQTVPKQRTTEAIMRYRKYSVFYYLKPAEDEPQVKVCRLFFLATFGYTKTSCSILNNIFNDSRRKRFENDGTIANRMSSIAEHIEHLKPIMLTENIGKRYMAADVTRVMLFDTYSRTNQHLKSSWNEFKVMLSELGIFLPKLGEEDDCIECSAHTTHLTSCDNTNECDICHQHEIHVKKVEESKRFYEADGKRILSKDDRRVYAQVRFQLHLLPRIDFNPELVRATRLITSSLIFSNVSPKSKYPSFVSLWNETVSGIENDDIFSAFNLFFDENRDARDITLWLDNDFEQTKNFLFFNFIVKIVACDEISCKSVVLKYFEEGHSLETSEHLNLQIEAAIKQKRALYDFNDLYSVTQATVRECGGGTVRKMYPDDFRNWLDDFNPENRDDLPELSDICMVKFTKSSTSGVSVCYSKHYGYIQTYDIPHLTGNIESRSKFKFDEPPEMSHELKDSITNLILPAVPFNRESFWKTILN